jgi:protocatechuate 3,4-dioxygenase beta subunit
VDRLGLINNTAFYRQDITEGRSGLPLMLTLTVVSTGQTFLRGLQTTDANGQVTFKTIYPGWYAGRATHIHVQVFTNGLVVKTTQVAFPEAISSAVYRTSVYAAHGQNSTTNARDGVFSDGVDNELAALSGDAASGYGGTLTIGVSV